jgi:3-phenylpropionate/cinnamic acid dioxygenase small subunit
VSAPVTAVAEELTQFVYDEARLIDEKRFDEWYELFTDDARYWMPLSRGQLDGENHTSLFYEDKLLLKVRIERLKSPRSFSQHQPSWCQHVLQRPFIEDDSAATGRYRVRTPFVYVESRLDEQLVLAGVVTHRLRRETGLLRIELKKVEITNCDASLPSIQLFP